MRTWIIGRCPARFGRWRRVAGVVLATAIILANLLAFFHARALTTYASGGTHVVRLERMSASQKAAILLTGVQLPRPTNTKTPADFGLSYETLTIVGDDGIDLEAWRIPCRRSRALVLMFHGYGSCKAHLLPEARAWRALGCETLLVDFRGSGGSSGNETTLGVYEADAVVKAMEFVLPLAGDQPVVLYGRSMGGAAVLRAIAIRGLQPAAIVVECPFDRLLTTVENRFSAMDVPAFPMAQLLVFWGGVQHRMDGFAHNPVEYAASIGCPALIMHGAHDLRVSVAEVQSIHERLPGDKRLILFAEAGHESYLAVDAALWNSTISEFLDSFVAIDRPTSNWSAGEMTD